MFHFVVHRLHFLSRIPFASQIFDAWLLAWTALRKPNVLEAMEHFQAKALGISGIKPRRHRYGGLGFVFEGREFGHVHSNGLLDVHLTRKVAGEMIESDCAQPHHVFGESAWVSFWIRSDDDVSNAIHLLKLAMKERDWAFS